MFCLKYIVINVFIEIKKSPGYLVCDIWVLTVSDINLSTICSSHQGVGGWIPGLDTHFNFVVVVRHPCIFF